MLRKSCAVITKICHLKYFCSVILCYSITLLSNTVLQCQTDKHIQSYMFLRPDKADVDYSS